ncbi:hypothetical protein BJV78DRAFT_1218974 [Lactifluus subvellereus]|nr:hypothetical protein BJV78DRAFT_1218974 [Lactifluus subvellereus]
MARVWPGRSISYLLCDYKDHLFMFVLGTSFKPSWLYSLLSDPKLATRLSKDGKFLNLTPEGRSIMARAVGGEQIVTRFMNKTLVSSDRVNVDLIGGSCTQDSRDVHIHPLNDRYNIVYWGGDAAEAHRLWTFQISHSHPIIQSFPVVFHPSCDSPVNLKENGITVFMLSGSGKELKEGHFMCLEGAVVLVDITSTHGTTTIPVIFPTRLHDDQFPPGTVKLPL